MTRLMPLLLALVLLPALAATCVVPATQTSPSGPWLGEVTNDTDDPMSRSVIYGQITDATGRMQAVAAHTCPNRLQQGETAAWEISSDGYDLAPPMTGVFRHDSSPGESSALSSGLRARIDEVDRDRNVAAVTIANRTPDVIGGIALCAVMRDASGTLAGVGYGQVTPSQLAGFASTTALLRFTSMPPGATFELHAQGQKLCCGPGVIATSSFRETARLLSSGGFADYPGVTRVLTVVGEITALHDMDLSGTIASAHVAGHPLYRAEPISAGCAGVVPRGETVPVVFQLPVPPELQNSKDPRYVINGIEGQPWSGQRLVRLPVANVTRSGAVVAGDVTNDTNTPVRVVATCFNAREAGALVGTSGVPHGPTLQPGERANLWSPIPSIGNPDSFEIIAYGEPSP